MSSNLRYYVPHSSWWPVFGGMVLMVFVLGLISWLHSEPYALWIIGCGAIGITILMIGWFRDIIHESLSGLYSEQLNQTFHLGMFWFITSEIWFFGALFGALCYARLVSVPWLGGGDGYSSATREFLYPAFEYAWPLLKNPNTTLYPDVKDSVSPWGLPAYNTAVLLISAGTLTLAHKNLLKGYHRLTVFWLFLTVSLGLVFLILQAQEYYHAMTALRILLTSGIYASTFYIITGFHGLHVLIGSLFLLVIMIRTLRGHFSEHNHFAFEAAAWYWHFVDTIWWAVFLFVYCV